MVTDVNTIYHGDRPRLSGNQFAIEWRDTNIAAVSGDVLRLVLVSAFETRATQPSEKAVGSPPKKM